MRRKSPDWNALPYQLWMHICRRLTCDPYRSKIIGMLLQVRQVCRILEVVANVYIFKNTKNFGHEEIFMNIPRIASCIRTLFITELTEFNDKNFTKSLINLKSPLQFKIRCLLTTKVLRIIYGLGANVNNLSININHFPSRCPCFENVKILELDCGHLWKKFFTFGKFFPNVVCLSLIGYRDSSFYTTTLDFHMLEEIHVSADSNVPASFNLKSLPKLKRICKELPEKLKFISQTRVYTDILFHGIYGPKDLENFFATREVFLRGLGHKKYEFCLQPGFSSAKNVWMKFESKTLMEANFPLLMKFFPNLEMITVFVLKSGYFVQRKIYLNSNIKKFIMSAEFHFSGLKKQIVKHYIQGDPKLKIPKMKSK